jgi:hypothetical protein
MNGSEVAAARVELEMSLEQMAHQCAVSTEDVRHWEMGLKDVPRGTAKLLSWLVLMKRRDRVMAASGLPDCEWVRSWNGTGMPEGADEAQRHIEALSVHARTCASCQARDQYAAKHLGPPPPMPGSGWLAVIAPIARFGMTLPGWARPALFGAVFLVAIVGFRLAIAVPIILLRRGFSVTGLLQVPLALGAAAAGGAIGGLGYSFVGKPLRRVPLAGPYLAGIVTVAAYMAGIEVVSLYAFHDPMIKGSSDLVIFAILSVIFGAVFGHAGFRDRRPKAVA